MVRRSTARVLGHWFATAGLVLPALGWQQEAPGTFGGEANRFEDEPVISDGIFGPTLAPALVDEFFSEEAIRAYDPRPIPDDPPPHEGAMFGLRHVVEPPDLILIEVLEAMPGRPITGERLVRPDGTVSLDFYGEIDVRGLTTDQIKIKVIELLRDFLTDEALGLVELEVVGPGGPMAMPGIGEPLPPPADLAPDALPELPPTRNPFDLDPVGFRPTATQGDAPAFVIPFEVAPPGDDGDPTGSGTGAPSRVTIETGNGVRITIETPSGSPPAPAEPEQPEAVPVPTMPGDWGRYVPVPPAESNRVFVDVAQYNSKVYYVAGDVARPGRLVCTGDETVLDALNYCDGLLATADPTDIRLARPSRGDRPARVYEIDLEAIHNGDASANLQIFPGDRLIVGRDPVVEASVALNRLAEPVFTFFNLIQSFGSTVRWLDEGGRAVSAGERERVLEGWAELWMSITDRVGAGDVAEDEVREQLRRLLVTPPMPGREDPAGPIP